MVQLLRAGALMLACLLFMAASTARAADPRPRLVLMEPTLAAGPRSERIQAVLARMRAELELLGVEVETAPARTGDPRQELARLAEQQADVAAASLALQTDQITLLFVAAGTNEVTIHVFGGSLAKDDRAGAVHAAELMRPTLLGLSPTGTKEQVAVQPEPAQPGAATASATSATSSDEPELPPGLRPPPVAPTPRRLFGELAAGILADVRFMSPQPVLSVLAGVRVSARLRTELLALVPLYVMVHENAGGRSYARASLLGLQLRVALIERVRGELALASGPALAIAAAAHEVDRGVGPSWTRHTALSLYARLGGTFWLSGRLSLHADLSLGSLLEPLRVPTSSDFDRSWGRLWLAAGLGLGAALL